MIFCYERDLAVEAFHRKHVVLRIQRDPRTQLRKNLLLGFPFHHVRHCVIKNGAVDFDAGHQDRFGVLTPDDLVLLYCYLYVPRHHAELRSTFDRCSTWIDDMILSNHSICLVDIGCGPGTVGLAFSDQCRGVPFIYFGCDRSHAMRTAAHSLLQKAKGSGLIANESEFRTASGMSNLQTFLNLLPDPVNVVFVASYLFASKTLDGDALADLLNAVSRHERVVSAAFLYLNSTTRYANRCYERFVRELGLVRRLGIEEQWIQYRRYAGRTTGNARFVNDCLILKETPQ